MQKQFTIVVSHYVKPDKEAAFEQALKQVIQEAKAYEGYSGIQIVQNKHSAEIEYLLLIRFETEAYYKVWEASGPRNNWFKELEQYILKESKIRYEEGIEFWFSAPQTSTVVPPKKWKMALLTWLVIYPSVLGLSTLAGILLDFAPTYLRIMAVSLTLVPLMTYVIMPQVTKAFAGWLFKPART